jgi:sulfite exporter TauE/SafE
MTPGLLVSAGLVGALGGAHCAAMCGGMVSAIAARDAACGAPRLRTAVRAQALYHAGRLGTYALLGAAFGVAGASARLAGDIAFVQHAMHVGASAFLLLLAASLVVRMPPVLALQRAGVALVTPLLRHAQPLLRAPGTMGRVTTGLAWGLMPCALVYSVLPLALMAGGPAQGALVMLAFGLGTLPNLFAGGVLLAALRRSIPTVVLRYAGATLIAAFGLFGLVHAFAAHVTLANLALCLVP